MMKKKDFENYIGSLLNEVDFDKRIMSELLNIQLLLSVYRLGLQHRDFPVEILLSESLEPENTPEEFHTLLAQMAIIKVKNANPNVMQYLIKNTNNLLERFKNYFIKI